MKKNKYKTALVIGAGAFGTSIASVLANNFEKVILKVRSKDVYDSINGGENSIYLPGHAIADSVTPIMEWSDLNNKEDIELIVSGLPASAIDSYFIENKQVIEELLQRGALFVSLSKGIDPDTLELSDDLFFKIWPEYKNQITFLSGPSFAKEIMQKHVTTVTLAGNSKDSIKILVRMFGTSYFRIFGSTDIKGTLLGGALKNVIAIAGGIVEGLGYNHNTRAALITRGISEMLRVGKVFNAKAESFYGLSGMGDLILTTTGGLSRNKQFGLEIAKGRSPKDILSSQRTVVEGYKTTRAVYELTKKHNIRARIFNGTYEVLYEERSPREVIAELMKIQSVLEWN